MNVNTEVRAGAAQSGGDLGLVPAWPRRSHAWYVVIVLTAAYTLSYIDRQVLGLMLEPIRHQMNLSDTQVSLLAGSAFALFYVVLGLPLGRLADRANRRNLIAAGIFLWSLMTAACGLAGNFWQLFAARVGVGVGEAALSPAALSIISDYFPPDERARPLTLYSLAIAIGSGLAFLAGGYMNALVTSLPHLQIPVFGPVVAWQATFIAVGAPGMIFALLILSIREPVRRGVRWSSAHVGPSSGGVPVAKVGEVVRFIWNENRQTFAVLLFAYGGFALYVDALLIWLPSVFARRFGWSPGHTGITMGLVIVICATAGILASVGIASRLQKRGSADALVRTSFLMALVLVPLGILLPLMDSPAWILALLAPVMALAFGLFAMAIPLLQLIAPNQMRAQISSIFSLFNNVIGLMAGATCVALLTDHLFHDPARVHHSLAVVATAVLPASTLLTWWGMPHISRSITVAKTWMGGTVGN